MRVFLFVQIAALFLNQTCFAASTKIDSEGRFLPFPGVTVVSSVGNQNKELWKKIYHSLNENSLITEYFTLLPVDSYHMTTINLFTASMEPGEGWYGFVTDHLPWFRSLNLGLEAQSIHPQVNVRKPLLSGALMISIKLKPEEEESIKQLAYQFGLLESVPPEFHVTLAYPFKRIPSDVQKSIKREVKKIVKEALNSYGHPIVFEVPRLCFFNDMTKFIPWNAESNPF